MVGPHEAGRQLREGVLEISPISSWERPRRGYGTSCYDVLQSISRRSAMVHGGNILCLQAAIETIRTCKHAGTRMMWGWYPRNHWHRFSFPVTAMPNWRARLKNRPKWPSSTRLALLDRFHRHCLGLISTQGGGSSPGGSDSLTMAQGNPMPCNKADRTSIIVRIGACLKRQP